MSPMANTSGCPGTVRSVSTTMRPPLVSSTPSISASGLARTPAAHTTTPAGSTVPSARWTRRSVRRLVMRATPTPVVHLDTAPRQRPPRPVARLCRHRPEQPRRGLDEDDPRGPHVEGREVLGEHPGEQLHHRPGGLDARRAAAAEHDVELAALRRWPGRSPPARSVEHGEAQVEGVVEVLQRDRVLVDAVDAERRRHGAGGDRPACRTASSSTAPSPRSSVHRPGVEVDADDRRHVHA